MHVHATRASERVHCVWINDFDRWIFLEVASGSHLRYIHTDEEQQTSLMYIIHARSSANICASGQMVSSVCPTWPIAIRRLHAEILVFRLRSWQIVFDVLANAIDRIRCGVNRNPNAGSRNEGRGVKWRRRCLPIVVAPFSSKIWNHAENRRHQNDNHHRRRVISNVR